MLKVVSRLLVAPHPAMGDAKPPAGDRTTDATATAAAATSADGSTTQENSTWKGGGFSVGKDDISGKEAEVVRGKGEALEQQGRELKRVEAALVFLKKGEN
jgi:hypothetical protein